MDTKRYFDRDLSWVDYNERILEEALRPGIPPLERFKFLTIVSSNFDEFFMVRVAALKEAGNTETVQAISEKVHAIMSRFDEAFTTSVLPELLACGLELVRPLEWTVPEMDFLQTFFVKEVHPLLTPLRACIPDSTDDSVPAASRRVYVAFLLKAEAGDTGEQSFVSLVELPSTVPRVIFLPKAEGRWALLDDVVLTWGPWLFQGYECSESLVFSLNRDADFSVDERRDEDFVEAMAEVLVRRKRSPAVRLILSPGSGRLRRLLTENLGLKESDVYEQTAPVHLSGLESLISARGFDAAREKPLGHQPSPDFSEDRSVWDSIREGDKLLQLPYESFDPVLRFFKEAARDSDVLAIKTTLYRTSGDSPIVRALEEAALSGKHVSCVVELKARFDEERNISWAEKLEAAGVIVVYGLRNLKVHAKAALVIRRENGAMRRYVHISTGNYDDKTAKIYSDLSFFTCDNEIAFDTGIFFNMLTGYSQVNTMRKLVIAPFRLKDKVLSLIRYVTERAAGGNEAKIMVKLNALADTDLADALYDASNAGVKIFLNVRGICVLRPGVKGMSENIFVTSIVGRFLEHSRILYFGAGGADDLFLSSADWMPRNFAKRVELLFPVVQPELRLRVMDMLESYFRDNTHASVLGEDGIWKKRPRAPSDESFSAQNYLAQNAAARAAIKTREEFVSRRKL
jgi:polyphosphate kinase